MSGEESGNPQNLDDSQLIHRIGQNEYFCRKALSGRLSPIDIRLLRGETAEEIGGVPDEVLEQHYAVSHIQQGNFSHDSENGKQLLRSANKLADITMQYRPKFRETNAENWPVTLGNTEDGNWKDYQEYFPDADNYVNTGGESITYENLVQQVDDSFTVPEEPEGASELTQVTLSQLGPFAYYVNEDDLHSLDPESGGDVARLQDSLREGGIPWGRNFLESYLTGSWNDPDYKERNLIRLLCLICTYFAKPDIQQESDVPVEGPRSEETLERVVQEEGSSRGSQEESDENEGEEESEGSNVESEEEDDTPEQRRRTEGLTPGEEEGLSGDTDVESEGESTEGSVRSQRTAEQPESTFDVERGGSPFEESEGVEPPGEESKGDEPPGEEPPGKRYTFSEITPMGSDTKQEASNTSAEKKENLQGYRSPFRHRIVLNSGKGPRKRSKRENQGSAAALPETLDPPPETVQRSRDTSSILPATKDEQSRFTQVKNLFNGEKHHWNDRGSVRNRSSYSNEMITSTALVAGENVEQVLKTVLSSFDLETKIETLKGPMKDAVDRFKGLFMLSTLDPDAMSISVVEIAIVDYVFEDVLHDFNVQYMKTKGFKDKYAAFHDMRQKVLELFSLDTIAMMDGVRSRHKTGQWTKMVDTLLFGEKEPSQYMQNMQLVVGGFPDEVHNKLTKKGDTETAKRISQMSEKYALKKTDSWEFVDLITFNAVKRALTFEILVDQVPHSLRQHFDSYITEAKRSLGTTLKKKEGTKRASTPKSAPSTSGIDWTNLAMQETNMTAQRRSREREEKGTSGSSGAAAAPTTTESDTIKSLQKQMKEISEQLAALSSPSSSSSGGASARMIQGGSVSDLKRKGKLLTGILVKMKDLKQKTTVTNDERKDVQRAFNQTMVLLTTYLLQANRQDTIIKHGLLNGKVITGQNPEYTQNFKQQRRKGTVPLRLRMSTNKCPPTHVKVEKPSYWTTMAQGYLLQMNDGTYCESKALADPYGQRLLTKKEGGKDEGGLNKAFSRAARYMETQRRRDEGKGPLDTKAAMKTNIVNWRDNKKANLLSFIEQLQTDLRLVLQNVITRSSSRYSYVTTKNVSLLLGSICISNGININGNTSDMNAPFVSYEDPSEEVINAYDLYPLDDRAIRSEDDTTEVRLYYPQKIPSRGSNDPLGIYKYVVVENSGDEKLLQQLNLLKIKSALSSNSTYRQHIHIALMSLAKEIRELKTSEGPK